MSKTKKEVIKESTDSNNQKKAVDQKRIAKIIASEMSELTLTQIQAVIQREQELTIMAVSEGRKVIKKNYLTLYPIDVNAKQWTSPLNGQTYNLPSHRSVGVRLGEGFKARVASKSMPRKMCRAVEKKSA